MRGWIGSHTCSYICPGAHAPEAVQPGKFALHPRQENVNPTYDLVGVAVLIVQPAACFVAAGRPKGHPIGLLHMEGPCQQMRVEI